jgi:hypothetical protein
MFAGWDCGTRAAPYSREWGILTISQSRGNSRRCTKIILGVINGIIDVALIWQCYYYAKWEQFTPVLTFLRLRRPPTAATEPPSDPPVSPNPTLVTPSLEPPKRSRRSTVLHVLYVLLVVGISIMVWGIVVARVRKTASLRAGEDGTDPDFSAVGAAFGWVSMVIYSKCLSSAD